MDFEQSHNSGPVDWNFPSPTATPTTGSFGNNVFHTPKSSTMPTHFQDAFTTPQMSTFPTPRQPQYASMTPLQRPQTSSETLHANLYADMHTGGGQSRVQAMPPPVQTEQNFSVVSPLYGNMQVAMNTSFDSSQMQTPPPTRGASAKKPQQQPLVAFGTPSTIASRRYMTPQQPAPVLQQTSAQFPQMQFSPDMYQFANIGPASAPAMPFSRVFWDPSTSPMQPVPQTALADPFAPQGLPWPSPLPSNGFDHPVSFDTPAMNSFLVQEPHPRSASAIPTTVSFTMAGTAPSAPAGVDPSLLYSSPMRPVVKSNSRVKKPRQQASQSDSKRKDDNATNHDRADAASYVDATNDHVRLGLRRSNTTGTTRPQTAHPSMSTSEISGRGGGRGLSHVPRAASPLKRFGRPTLGSISEGRPRQRASVILTVDENGRARTETRPLDESPTRSIRERYPALFDSDSSDAESDASDATQSQAASFTLDKRDERRAKAARLDPPVENLEGLTIPRSSSSASMRKGVPPSRAAVAAAAQLRRQSSLRRLTPSRKTSRRSLTTSSIDTAALDTSSSQAQQFEADGATEHHHPNMGDQPFFPHNVAANGWQPPPPPSFSEPTPEFVGPSSLSPENLELEAHNRRWSMMSFEQQQQQQQQHAISPSNHQQPLTFPNRSLPVRCICGVPSAETGLPLVQCRSCTQWLHAPCVGLGTGGRGGGGPMFLPASETGFTCFLCTRPAAPVKTTGRGGGRKGRGKIMG